ncbi:hypothetical protein PR048_021327 [Dryococelus australis]|uniref:Uncharacterized protein n=1 Tax=Dryococelus australis TaxID=614101 RepID=A0ABQ9GY16_9NEOP|nr:hypothetical protein PR048_021327 [Dryococelus australis]
MVEAAPGEPGSIPGWATTRFSHVRIVSDDSAGQPVFSGISRFLRPFVQTLIHTYLTSSFSVLKT